MFAQKFREAGYDADQDRLYVAATKVLHSAKPVERFADLLRADIGLLSAISRHYLDIVAKDMNGPGDHDEEARHRTNEPHPSIARADTGEGQDATANPPATASAIVRPINRSARSIAALAAQTLTLTIFDSFKIRDGRGIGDVAYRELEELETSNTREARVLRSIRYHLRPVDTTATVRDLIKESTLKLFIEQADRHND